MDTKKAIWIAIICLIVALIGLIVLYSISFYSPDLLVKVQIGSILYLALLSFGIFFDNQKAKLARRVPEYLKWIANSFGYVVFVLFAFDFVFTMKMYWDLTQSVYIPMVSATAVAIGLYFANKVFNRFES